MVWRKGSVHIMRQTMLMLLLCPLACLGLTRSDVDPLLAKAATAQSNAYIEARDAIVALGTNALPLLFDAAADANADWSLRLVARICYERAVRGNEIEALRNRNWREDPDYDSQWDRRMSGPGGGMTDIVVPKFVEAGLWYFYVEATWKCPDEMARMKAPRINQYWARWGRKSLLQQPEVHYLWRALQDQVDRDSSLTSRYDAVELFGILLNARIPDAVPVLVQRYEAYNKRKVIGPEMYPGENAKIFAIEFAPIFNIADERHAALLEAYIAEHPALAELKPKLAAVRARPAPPPVPDPPFRLGTNLVTRPPAVP